MHFVDVLLNEVACCGLEGTTLTNLWGFLGNPDSGFPWVLDENAKQFLWKTLISMKCISFFVNPKKTVMCSSFDRRNWLKADERGHYYAIPVSVIFRLFSCLPGKL